MFTPKMLMLCLTAILSVASVAKADLIVVPNGNTTVEGNARLNTAPLNNASRYQQIFSASQFGNSTSPILITQLAFRPDATQASAFSNNISQLRLDLSTTSTTVAGLSSTLASNIGANNATVFNSAITLSSANLPGPGNTKLFDIVITLTTSFLYDPTAGNLLLDMRNFGSAFTGFVDAQGDSSGTITRLAFVDNDPNGTTGSVQAGGAVIEFGYVVVPVPSGVTLVLMAFVCGLSYQVYRRQSVKVQAVS